MAKQQGNKSSISHSNEGTKSKVGWLDFGRDRAKVSIVLALVVFVLYANTLWHEYTQDDAIVITDNMFTTKGISGIPGLFKYDTFYGFFKEEGKAALVSGGRYRPLTPAMFAIEYQLFGMDPFWGHLLNICWYAVCCIVLYLTLFQLLTLRAGPYAGSIAALTALVFAVHPVHTEVVANIKGRDEIMAMLFSLGALWSVISYADRTKLIYLAGGALSFFLGLLSKENTITFLAIIPLSIWIFREFNLRQGVKYMAPLLVVTMLFLAIRTQVIGQLLSPNPPKELMNNPFLKLQGSEYVPFSSPEKSATIVFTLGKYLQLMLFPHPLTHDYYPRHIGIKSWSEPGVLISFLVYVIMIIWSLIGLRHRRDVMAYGIAFYLLSLSLVSNIIFPVGTNLSERFLFMPSAGLVLAFSWWMHENLWKVGLKRLFIAINLAILLLLGWKTLDRNKAWASNATLFFTDIAISGNSAKLRNAVGGEKIRLSTLEKDEEKAKGMLLEAIEHLNKAIEIHPLYKNAYLLLGNAHFYLKNFDESISNYEKSLALDPNYRDALSNIGIAYQQGGRYHGEVRNDLPKAIQYLESALRYLPEDYETHRLLGIAYAFHREPVKAKEHFIKAVELEPEIADAWKNLGNVYAQMGDMVKANECFRKSEELNLRDKK